MATEEKTVEISLPQYELHSLGINKDNPGDFSNAPLDTTTHFRSDACDKGYVFILRKCENMHLVIPRQKKKNLYLIYSKQNIVNLDMVIQTLCLYLKTLIHTEHSLSEHHRR